jgi:hypothetical protein
VEAERERAVGLAVKVAEYEQREIADEIEQADARYLAHANHFCKVCMWGDDGAAPWPTCQKGNRLAAKARELRRSLADKVAAFEALRDGGVAR